MKTILIYHLRECDKKDYRYFIYVLKHPHKPTDRNPRALQNTIQGLYLTTHLLLLIVELFLRQTHQQLLAKTHFCLLQLPQWSNDTHFLCFLMMRSQVHVPGLVPMHESVAEIWAQFMFDFLFNLSFFPPITANDS